MSESIKRAFPVLGYKEYEGCPATVDWEKLDNNWALEVHGQSLEKLASRGGLCPEEIVFNVDKLRWASPVDREYAINKVKQLHVAFIMSDTPEGFEEWWEGFKEPGDVLMVGDEEAYRAGMLYLLEVMRPHKGLIFTAGGYEIMENAIRMAAGAG